MIFFLLLTFSSQVADGGQLPGTKRFCCRRSVTGVKSFNVIDAHTGVFTVTASETK